MVRLILSKKYFISCLLTFIICYLEHKDKNKFDSVKIYLGQDYVESKDKLRTLEEKRFSIANDLAKSDRAEKIAIGKFGADSKQAVEEGNRKAKLQQAHDKVLIQMNREDNATKVATTKTGLEPKDILKYKTDFRASHPDYLAWQQDMINRKGKGVVNTPEFKQASEILLNQLIARDASLSAPATGKAKFLGFE